MTDHSDNLSPGATRPGDDQFSSTAGRMLRDSADELDASTAARLERGRQLALEESGRRRAGPASWLPALATAAVAVLAVALWVSQEQTPAPPVAAESAADMDLLLAADSLEMLEDLDFYTWLDSELGEDEPPTEPGSTS